MLCRPDNEQNDGAGGHDHDNRDPLLEEKDLFQLQIVDCLSKPAAVAEEKGEDEKPAASCEFSFTFYDLDGGDDSPTPAANGKEAPVPRLLSRNVSKLY